MFAKSSFALLSVVACLIGLSSSEIAFAIDQNTESEEMARNFEVMNSDPIASIEQEKTRLAELVEKSDLSSCPSFEGGVYSCELKSGSDDFSEIEIGQLSEVIIALEKNKLYFIEGITEVNVFHSENSPNSVGAVYCSATDNNKMITIDSFADEGKIESDIERWLFKLKVIDRENIISEFSMSDSDGTTSSVEHCKFKREMNADERVFMEKE